MNKTAFIIDLCVLSVLAMTALNTSRPPEAPMPENVVAALENTQATAVPLSFQIPISFALTQGTTANSIDFGIPEDPLIPDRDKPPLAINTSVQTPKSVAQIPLPDVSQVIGFTFPDGTIAIKAAPYNETPSSNQDGELTPVGVVDIGEGGSNPGTYEVNLDLEGSTQCVSGELRPKESNSNNTLSVRFVRTELVPNPERVDQSETWPSITDEEMPTYNSAVITADSVCFVVKSGESYFRYCSVPGSDLSAMNNKSQYSAIVDSIRKTAERFGLQNDIEYSQTISTLEDYQHIQECNDTSINSGEKGEEWKLSRCHSDITAAPVTQKYLKKNFGSVIGLPTIQSLVAVPSRERDACTPCKSPYTVHYGDWVWKIGRRCDISPYAIIKANGLLPPYWLYPGDVLILPRNAPPFPGRPRSNVITSQLASILGSLPFSDALALFARQDQPATTPISVTVGVIKVHRKINYANERTVYPGDYRLDYWFDENENFYAATLSGFGEDGSEVTNLQIPAVPAAFVNADGSEPVSAQISACRIFRRCVFFQRRCP
jgi:hypothetical protein